MTNRPQILRSSTPGQVPTAGTRLPGELWTTFPDLQLGVIDASKNAQRLIAIRFFSTTANYAAGDFVVQGGKLWFAKASITAGAFNATQWSQVAALTDIPAVYILPTASTTVLGGVKIDGATVSIDGGGVISVPGAVASSTLPIMDGSAAVGVGITYARADHVHPTDVSRASTTTPVMNGVAAVGVGTTWARADHVHPTDTTLLAKTGGTLTGALTPSSTAGLVGTTTNDSANAGAVGEVISSNVTAGVSVTTATGTNITSISLTAGDWDVCGEVWFLLGTGGATLVRAGINSVSATLPTTSSIGTARMDLAVAFTASANQVFSLRPCRVSLASTTTYYLIGLANFPSGTVTATGNIIARRAR